ncbi:hypothetical protein Sjap_001680 [Stephania japonica]|uniref:Uncharacterized protein n=1 Tax=Stephania japonica TaxID=461633 RepID=A0AAP0KMZ0_9MAGN
MRILTTPTYLQFPPPTIHPKPPHSSKPSLSFTTRASDPESDPSSSSSSSDDDGGGDSFDRRLAEVRLRYRSGAGKKAEARRGKKSSSKEGGVFLPPVPLKEPLSGGTKVEVGFSPYTERLNGRLAGLGLTALLLVELASGTSLVKYHSPSVLFVQVYFVAAVGALYVKYEKERVGLVFVLLPSFSPRLRILLSSSLLLICTSNTEKRAFGCFA